MILLVLPSLTCGEILHVRPTSPDTSCPTYPCHTLSEYAQHPGQYFNHSNLTLEFLPGNHTLDVNLTVRNIHQLEILGNSSAVVQTRVVCSPSVGLTFRDIFEVKMDSLAFVSCARLHLVTVQNDLYFEVHLQSVQTAEINDCTFQDSYGSALGVIDSYVVLRGNNKFLSNCRMCSNGRCGPFMGPTCDGGGVFADRSNLSFTGNIIFFGNSADRGGGIYTKSNCNLDISGNITFINNTAKGGGAISTGDNSNVMISGNTSFIHNSARTNGGGVDAGSLSNITISGNATFIGNSAGNGRRSGDGGAVYAYLSNVMISGNANFISNSAGNRGGDGGAVYAYMSNVMVSGNTSFIDNSAEQNGGGVYAYYQSNINISGNTIFINNSARGGIGHRRLHVRGVYWFAPIEVGGGVYVKNTNMDINGNVTFIANSAKYGGGVYVGYNSNVNIGGNATFIGNSATARDGGGVCLESYSSVGLSGNATFISNSAMRDGGGVSTKSNSNLNISGNMRFSGNSASGNGGGLYVASGSNVKISGNMTYTSHSAMYGGCIFIGNSLSLEGSGSFTNCSASDGGAIYASRIQVTFSGTNIFSSNSAEHFGGGLYMTKSSLNFSGNNSFIANTAGSRGGGMYVQETKISFSGTGLLSDNVAQLDGGGIYADGSNLNFSGNLKISHNTAMLGGGVYSDNNTFIIDGHNVIESNFAYYGGGIYIRRSPLTLVGDNTFISNLAGEGGGIYATANGTLNLNGVNTFFGNRAHISGGGIWLDNSKLALNGFNCFVECSASYEGGAIFTYAATASLPGNNTFESNSAVTGGGLHARWSNVTVEDSSNFVHNIALFGGGSFIDNSTLTFDGFITFRGNKANYTGGGIHAARSVLNFLGTSSIIANYAARDGGGLYTRDGCNINLLGLSNYRSNSAEETGGGISAFRSSFNLDGQNSFANNKAVEGGGFYAFKSTVNITGENTFVNNSAAIHGGGFTVRHSTLYLIGSTNFGRNFAPSGGGMYIGNSSVDIDGSNCFMNNMAKSEGGVIDARNSVVEFNGKNMFVSNSAGSKGAAIHLSFTNLIFRESSSFVSNSAKYGGGIHTESSNLTFVHHASSHHKRVLNFCNNASSTLEFSFRNNLALRGGAQYFDLYSIFSLDQMAHVHFQDNHATEFGGAIYAVDVPGPGQFLFQQHVPFRNECFFHILKKKQFFNFDTSPLVFQNNSAGIRGSVLYGGLLEKCNFTSSRYSSALELFNMSILHTGRKDDVDDSISSDPTQLCFCNKSEHSCGEVMQSRSIFPGQQVVVSVVAIDQSGLEIPTLIHATIYSGHNLTVSETISYETGSNCFSRNYTATPKSIFNQLELYPSNRSGDIIHLTVSIIFEACPIGFEQSNVTGECICDHRLWQYTNSCSINRQAVMRNASRTFWLGVSYNNGTFEGFIGHRYCPLDYCTKEGKHINLNNPDEQCNFNHSGLLCGKCKEGLSLVLGSSQCKKCSNNYLLLLIPFALAGVLLVILLFLLHLTVTAGTLHGLVFYANIVAANHHIFFPQSSNNPAGIFIAWVNLDLGIQTCFYNGMDAYAKTWLEFAFPVYIWVIVGFLVYISHRSVTVTKLLGSSPVPVLATLFLLSYAKNLRTILAALSLTILHYPHKDVVVWIHDANVSLAKYIPLVLVALLFLLFLFLPYTLLLLLGQWLQPKCHFCLLSWVRNPKVKAILDTYHAPYKPKHRYWTGLLLLVRCVLFLVFAFNISGDSSINLLVISSTASAITVGYALSGMVYKSWYLNALELSFILNLGILAVATYHVNLSGGSQAAVAYTSVGIAFFTFVVIFSYHVYIQIKSKVQYIKRGNQLQRGNNKSHINNNNDNPGCQCHQPRATPIVTHTEVNLHELRSPLDLLSYHQMN